VSALKVFGICMVRDEVDVVRLTVLHHLSLGLERILVLDNGSQDGTDRVLDRLARDQRVHWRRDDRGFRPGELGTMLAREAFGSGATWVVPFDADEFWHVPGGSLPAWLAGCGGDAVEVPVVNFVQRRQQRASSAEGLLHATHRAARPFGPIEACQAMVEAKQIGYVEILYPTKWASRTSATLTYAAGYHAVTGVEGLGVVGVGAAILHVPLRSRAAVDAKAEQGRRVLEAGYEGDDFWHSRRFHRLRLEGCLEAEWAANSYQDGALDVYGARHPLAFDGTLRDLLQPLVRRPLWRRLWPAH
jgi:hypothetical protein